MNSDTLMLESRVAILEGKVNIPPTSQAVDAEGISSEESDIVAAPCFVGGARLLEWRKISGSGLENGTVIGQCITWDGTKWETITPTQAGQVVTYDGSSTKFDFLKWR